MKLSIALAALLFAPAFAHAHGSVAHMASEAVNKAGEMFTAAQPRETQRLFQSITATRTGNEEFAVEILLKDGVKFVYACEENEDVTPPVWECTAK
jgi:hypothetical protein